MKRGTLLALGLGAVVLLGSGYAAALSCVQPSFNTKLVPLDGLAQQLDGDRVAVAVRGEGGFELLSGNDIGLLLADDLLGRYQQAGQPVVI